jgi:hypothetical protein
VTIPEREPIVATLVLPDVQAPLEVMSDSKVVPPADKLKMPVMADGIAVTDTVAKAVLTQPGGVPVIV